MDLIEIVKDCMPYTAVMVGYNFVVGPLSGAAMNSVTQFVHPNFAKTDYSQIGKYTSLPDDFNALDYLVLASSIVHNNSKNLKDCFCRHYARQTMWVYDRLVRQNARPHLRKDIRLAANMNYGDLNHMYIEVKHKGAFVPFESMSRTPRLKVEDVKDYAAKKLRYKMDGTGAYDDGCRVIMRTIPGTQIFYPTIDWLKAGGFISFLIYPLREGMAERLELESVMRSRGLDPKKVHLKMRKAKKHESCITHHRSSA